MAVRNIKLVIQYDGTNYHGWQEQPEADTIQGRLTAAIEALTGQRVRVNGSSRTDAGVHALGQAANVRIDTAVPTANFATALNRLLPDDIAVVEACDVPEAFDAISDAVSKRYRYTIDTGPCRSVMQIRFCWHRPGRLDIEAMRQAAGRLVGTNDFKSFASAADTRESSVRTISDFVVEADGPQIHIEVEADGFLYNMVRNLVGTLVEVGRGRWSPDRVSQVLAARDRAAAGPIAPPAGLCLLWIRY